MTPTATLQALLGPTNTGKTHRAVERMLEHPTGMIGLPLRLLAREVYDRVSTQIGEARVALVTGEEKRVPRNPAYWVCTVEAMPVERRVHFLAVDEIQLASHPERGHVFTDRLLNARGATETWFMGAETVRPLLEALLPTATIRRHPRFSRLQHAGSSSLGALPPRTAIVAFSMPELYALAERVRARRGGAAVVLGALSPRARNAQVALYQSGEVDYIVATDAIGMGLNLDIDLVAFASLSKFDGRQARPLDAAEMAQIAGRAGRHLNDGGFATLAPQTPIPKDLARAIEAHELPRERRLVWRNSNLIFESVDELLESLMMTPRLGAFRLIEHACDFSSLKHLGQLPEVQARTLDSSHVRLLWDVCQIPDYRRLLLGRHVAILEEIFLALTGRTGTLDDDWLEPRVARLDDPTGDLDTLMNRIAFARTWTYVSHHPSWVRNATVWQERTRQIEDRLSDALHAALVERFVEKGRTRARAARRPRAHRRPLVEEATIDTDGPFAQLRELRAHLTEMTEPVAEPTARWVDELTEAPHGRFRVTDTGLIADGDLVLAELTPGNELLRPEVALSQRLELGAGARRRVRRRLLAWTRDWIEALLEPIRAIETLDLGHDVRGLLYQLECGLGTIATPAAKLQLDALAAPERTRLERAGLTLGRRHVFARAMLKPAAIRHRVLLCRLAHAEPTQLPAAGALSYRAPKHVSSSAQLAIGYPIVATHAVRCDAIERVVGAIDPTPTGKVSTQQFAAWLGCSLKAVPEILRALGLDVPEGHPRRRRRPARPPSPPPREPR